MDNVQDLRDRLQQVVDDMNKYGKDTARVGLTRHDLGTLTTALDTLKWVGDTLLKQEPRS